MRFHLGVTMPAQEFLMFVGVFVFVCIVVGLLIARRLRRI